MLTACVNFLANPLNYHTRLLVLIFSFVDAPLAIITYNNMNYTSEQELYLEFDDNAQGPTILCSSGGHLPPTIGWVRENGGGLPNGISQTVLLNGEVLLRWQRPIEFTDSGSYHCQASNNIANSSASLELLVKSEFTYVYAYCQCSMLNTQSWGSAYRENLMIFLVN